MDNIFYVAKPFLSFLKVFGLFPMSFCCQHPKKCVKNFKWTDFVPSILHFSFLLALVFSCTPMTIQLAKRSVFLSKAWTIISAADISSFLAMLVYQLWKRKNILRFLTLIHDFDTKALTIGISMNWKQQKLAVFHILVFAVPIAVFLSCHNFTVNEIFGLEHVALTTLFRYAYIFCFHIIYVLQFVLPCMAIIFRFKNLNHHLESSANVYMPHETNEICQLYHKLCDGVEIINQTVTFPIAPIFIIILVRLISESILKLINF